MKKYLLGLDGGGTKTDMFIFTADGELVSHARGGATNHEAYEGGFDEMIPVFDALLDDALGKAGLSVGDISASAFGMAGIDVPSQKTRMDKYLESKGFSNFRVANDSFLGVKAACRNGVGVSFVNGTGNSVGGIDRHGNWLQVGGTGENFGDVGGAGGMTGRIIFAVYSMYYRCGKKTSMADKFFRLLGIDSPERFTEAIYDKLYTNVITNKDVHNEVFYPAVAENDEVALDVLRGISCQFGESLAGCINNLDFEDTVDIVCVGSATVYARSPLLLEYCRERTEALCGKKVNLFPLDVPPAAGAILWAVEIADGIEKANLVRDKVLKELEK